MEETPHSLHSWRSLFGVVLCLKPTQVRRYGASIQPTLPPSYHSEVQREPLSGRQQGPGMFARTCSRSSFPSKGPTVLYIPEQEGRSRMTTSELILHEFSCSPDVKTPLQVIKVFPGHGAEVRETCKPCMICLSKRIKPKMKSSARVMPKDWHKGDT